MRLNLERRCKNDRMDGRDAAAMLRANSVRCMKPNEN